MVSHVVNDPDGNYLQKEEDVEEKGNVGENNNHVSLLVGNPSSMEQELHKPLLVHDFEEKEEEELEHVSFKRTTLLHVKDNNLVTGLVTSSSSSATSNGGGQVDSNGVNGNSLEKEEEVEEKGNVGENNNRFIDDKEDYAAVGLGLIVEFAETTTNGEAITSDTFGDDDVLQKNNTSVYFDNQQVLVGKPSSMEQELHQPLIVHENEEEELEHVSFKRTTLPHGKDNLVTGLVTSSAAASFSSFSSPSSNVDGQVDSNGVNTVINDPDENSLQKEEEVEEKGNVSENNNHLIDDKEDYAAVRLGLVAEFAGKDTNGEAIYGATFDNDDDDDDDVDEDDDDVLKNGGGDQVDSNGVNTVVNNSDENSLQKEEEVEDYAAVGLGLVVEFAGTATNGEAITSATFGDDDVLWKNNTSVYFNNQQGYEVIGFKTVQNGDPTRYVCPTIPEETAVDVQEQNSAIQNNNLGNQLNNQYMKTVNGEVPSSSELSALHNSSVRQTTDVVNFEEEIKKENKLIEEIDEQVKEYDVEVVLEKQETHDLFCPNCNSCITKRFILKKRKRNIQNLDREKKKGKFENLVATSEITSLDPPPDDDNPERDVEVFRCLSCFSIFIPKVNGFKLFRSFGGASKHETSQNSSSIPARDLQNPSNLPGYNANSNWFSSLFSSKKGKTATENGSISETHIGSSICHGYEVIGFNTVQNGDPTRYVCPTIPKEIAFDVQEQNSAIQNAGDVIVTIEKETHESTTFQTADNVPVDGAITTESQTQVDIGEQSSDVIGEPRQWEIIKSVVYGGLIESITSLGIVSSAASSGATPLNIIALGFANLIGGLFILGHNIKDLKNDHYGTKELQTNLQDRYQEQLGHGRNFLLHVLVALLSFIIFGAVPIVIYGLLIDKDYSAEVKLTIAAATSVACIILLSSLKVYTRRPPKSYFKTVLSYVTMAIAASGVSYMAGNLFKDLLEKFYHSESGFAIIILLNVVVLISLNYYEADNVEVMSSTSFSDGTVTKYDSVKSVTTSTSETHSNSTQTAKHGILNPWEEEPEFLEIVNNGDSSSKQGTQSAVESFGSTVLATDIASNNQSSAIDAIFPSKPDISPVEKANINEKINSSAGKEKKGKGFKLFRIGGTRKHETSQNPSSIPAHDLQNPSNLPKSNPIISSKKIKTFFRRKKGKTATEQGNISSEHSGTGPSEISHPVGPLSETAPIENGKTLSDINHGNEVKSIGKESIAFSLKEESLNGKLTTNEEDKRNTSVYTTKTSKLRFQDKNSFWFNINERINSSVGIEIKGDAVINIDEETTESTTFQTADNVSVDGAITTESQAKVGIDEQPKDEGIDEQPRDEVGELRQWEIIKSVVYGGLIESITSLGIVSSAASSGATPLNITALGFANLIVGLFILGHNLKDLKNDHYGTEEPQTNPQDRYQEQLGHRRNFLLHVLVALLSFLIFGAVPIVIYGLLINKDYYPEVKLAIVVATSVACIILLGRLKVYTRRPPKSYFRTALSYVTMAIAASGVSYMAGNLFKDLLEKFYHSESGFAITMPLSDRGVEKSWTSY